MLDLLIRNVRIATCADDNVAVSPPGFVGVQGGRIACIGEMKDLGTSHAAHQDRDGGGALLTPGFIDCHTHLVYAGDRAREFDLRLRGASYEDIAKAGGGIRSTVKLTREADERTLFTQSAKRLKDLMR